MLLKRLLVKIETGQILTKKQERTLANKLYLERPFYRSLLYTIIVALVAVFFVVGAITSHWLMYVISVALVCLLLYLIIFPKYINIRKYLTAVEKFYESKFKEYPDYDVLYIGQQVNQHIRLLKSPKLYLLSDGYHFLFINDYFVDTEYQLPKYLTKGNKTYLRILNDQVTDNNRIMVRLPDVEYYYLVTQERVEEENKKFFDKPYYTMFLDQDTKMNEDYVVIKMKGGIMLRLSYEAYELFTESMPLKEREP